ncbi:MAG: uroporphyrinogen decarboxylase family protein [Syntrophomonas sp.]
MLKKRLQAAASKKLSVDRPPCICPGGMMNMMFQDIMELSGIRWPDAHLAADKMAGLATALFSAEGFENFGVPFCMTVEAEAMGAQVNMGSLLVEPHITKSYIDSVEDLSKLKQLDTTRGRVKVVLDAVALLKEYDSTVPIIGNITGPISVAGSLLDMSMLLKEFRKKPEASIVFMDLVAENLIRYGQALLEAGVDLICLSEPSGTGEILGPRHFRNYTVKYINRVLDELQAPLSIVHICGSLHSVYDVLPEIHCNIFSFDSSVSIADVKKVLPEKALMGNVSTHALGTSSPEKITQLVNFCRQKGINIISPACGLPTTTPLINVQTMVRAAKELIPYA